MADRLTYHAMREKMIFLPSRAQRQIFSYDNVCRFIELLSDIQCINLFFFKFQSNNEVHCCTDKLSILSICVRT